MDLRRQTLRVNGVRIHFGTVGQGPPVVLLHGWPQTGLMWRKVLPRWASHYTLIVPDLRGYGESDRPPSGYDKRTMAEDIRGVLRRLGYREAALVGHDRGARVAYRWALDHPEEVRALVVLDIIPTGEVFRRVDAQVARRYFHWFFFLLPDLPEHLLGQDLPGFLRWVFRTAAHNRAGIEPEAEEAYIRACSVPGSLRAMLADYRAGWEVDRVRDWEDMEAGRRIQAPTLALWGEEGAVPQLWPDAPDIWRRWCREVETGAVSGSGHFIPEEQPHLLAERVEAFLRRHYPPAR